LEREFKVPVFPEKLDDKEGKRRVWSMNNLKRGKHLPSCPRKTCIDKPETYGKVYDFFPCVPL